ncbi:DUF6635 family protein [Pseudoroseicyclus sp. CXY001]|uniref:DUF6635 family protein n=1 Tax=Pseudoroseicyclus sp. CXY001 TaxID=3242492 RepID=UPI003571671C
MEPVATAEALTDLAPPDPFAAARARVDAFCDRHFTFRGSLRLHRAALGWDLLRAPANVVLAPLQILSRLGQMLLRALRLRRPADWLARHPLVFETDLSDRVAAHIRAELLPEGAEPHLPAYAESRGAMAELATQIGTLGTGAVLFKSLTPGMLSFAPAVALGVAQSAAIAAFPLGAMLGSGWYALFPAAASTGLTAGTMLGFAAFGALLTAFAGVIADPIQRRLGIHQRRLLRLIAAAEGRARGFSAREPYLARLGDAADLAATLTKAFRS